MTYYEAEAELNGRASRKVGNNTYLERRNEHTIAVRLYQTDVVVFHDDGSTTYDSGGWRTITTKSRLNEYGEGVQVFAERRVWQVKTKWNHEVQPFQDGMTIR